MTDTPPLPPPPTDVDAPTALGTIANGQHPPDDLTALVAQAIRNVERPPPAEPPYGPEHDTGPPWKPPALSGAAFLDHFGADVTPVWGAERDILWAAGQPAMIVGPSGVGKTTLAQQLMLGRMGLRNTVLGVPVAPGNQRVLYLAMDRPAQASSSLARMIHTDAERQLLDELLIVWPGPLPFDAAIRPGELAEMVKAFEADTLVIDSLKDVVATLNDDETSARFNSAIQQIVTNGCEVITQHHHRKTVSGQTKALKTIDDVYGGMKLTAGQGTVLSLWGESGDELVTLSQLKSAVERVGPWQVEHDHEHGTSARVRERDELDIVRAHGGAPAVTVARELIDKKVPSDADIKRIKRRLDKLVDRDLLVKRAAIEGGAGGSTPAMYYPVDSRREEPM
jgi:replicative DNA helicase